MCPWTHTTQTLSFVNEGSTEDKVIKICLEESACCWRIDVLGTLKSQKIYYSKAASKTLTEREKRKVSLEVTKEKEADHTVKQKRPRKNFPEKQKLYRGLRFAKERS